jgi:DNA-binding MarR family transcriptional regulator
VNDSSPTTGRKHSLVCKTLRNANRCICIYLSMTDALTRMPKLPCLCASFRRTSRALTQLYDQVLRPLGLRAPQFTTLQVISSVGEVSQGELGRILALDSTTLTRTLQIMARRGWIVARRGQDRRVRRFRLTQPGAVQLQRALPHWEKLQTRLRRRLGNGRWENLLNSTNEVTKVVTE